MYLIIHQQNTRKETNRKNENTKLKYRRKVQCFNVSKWDAGYCYDGLNMRSTYYLASNKLFKDNELVTFITNKVQPSLKFAKKMITFVDHGSA